MAWRSQGFVCRCGLHHGLLSGRPYGTGIPARAMPPLALWFLSPFSYFVMSRRISSDSFLQTAKSFAITILLLGESLNSIVDRPLPSQGDLI
jgi:hypothetical protein